MKAETIKRAIAYSGKSISQVARDLNQSPSNFMNKLARNSFRDADLKEIAADIGAVHRDYFEFPRGVRVEDDEETE